MPCRRAFRAALPAALAAGALAAATLLAPARPAAAAGEAVSVWFTTTSDAAGRTVTRGLAPQPATAFAAGGGSGQQITVDEGTTFQQFEGAGASMTDTAAWLLGSSGLLSAAARDDVLRRIFDPTTGIGLSFLRNPIGASDLARSNYTFDDLP